MIDTILATLALLGWTALIGGLLVARAYQRRGRVEQQLECMRRAGL